MTICIVFKNGYELKTKCEEAEVTTNVLGRATSINYKGVTENEPLGVNFEEVLCVYRVMSDEK